MRPASNKRFRGGLTILEMLVSVALLSFIIIGLTAMFVQVSKAFKSGIKQDDSTDAGRAVIDMIADDLAQLSDPHFTTVTYPEYTSTTNSLPSAPPTLFWSFAPTVLYQVFTNADTGLVMIHTNELQDLFITVQTNANWLGIGYTVSNWFTTTNTGSSVALPGVGTLYRFVTTNVGPLFLTNLQPLISSFWTSVGNQTYTNTYFHRIADGVVHLKITAFDADGNEMWWEPGFDTPGLAGAPTMPNSGTYGGYLQYPEIYPNAAGQYQTNYLPHSVDIEVGILEPEAFEHVRSLYSARAYAAAGQYLTNAANQVQFFRQHVIIPAAP